MSTDHSLTSQSPDAQVKSATQVAPTQTQSVKSATSAQSIPELVKVMQSVKTDSSEAKLNEHSISDGNGGRIEMNDHAINQTFKGVEPRNSQVFRGVEQPKQNRE